MQGQPRKRRVFVGLFVADAVGLMLAALVGSALAQSPAGEATRPAAPANTPAASATNARQNADLKELRDEANEAIELLDMQLQTKRDLLQIGEKRLEDARHWKAHYASLLREGKVTEERYLAARDDVLMLEAHLASEKAELKADELRLKFARQRLEKGTFVRVPIERRLAEVEQRLAEAEAKIDLLQHSLGRLLRETPGETKVGR